MRSWVSHWKWTRWGRGVPVLAACLALAGGLPPRPLAAQATPAAIVLAVDGEVSVIRDQGDATAVRTAAPGMRLLLGERVSPESGASVTVVTRSGERRVLDGPAVLTPPEDPAYGDIFVRAAGLLARAVNAAGLSSPNVDGDLRRAPGLPVPIAPRNGILVLEAQPRLTWSPVAGAARYTLVLRSEDGPTIRHATGDTTFVVPRALAPGRRYFWTVEVEDRAAPEAAFRTLSDADATGLVQGLAQLREAGFDPDGEGRLLKVVLFSDLGLYYAALSELTALEASAGALAPEAWLLKGEILDRLGLLEQARAAFRRAAEAGAS